MYSLTSTSSHLTYEREPHAPRLRVVCDCSRRVIQEEIYTCLSCASYSCPYCSIA